MLSALLRQRMDAHEESKQPEQTSCCHCGCNLGIVDDTSDGGDYCGTCYDKVYAGNYTMGG